MSPGFLLGSSLLGLSLGSGFPNINSLPVVFGGKVNYKMYNINNSICQVCLANA